MHNSMQNAQVYHASHFFCIEHDIRSRALEDFPGLYTGLGKLQMQPN